MKKLNPDKILIMCGGKGKRLGDLTKKLPKPLMKIKNQTILEMKIRKYMQQGFKDFIICIGHKGNLIKEVIKKNDFSNRVRFSDAGVASGILKRLYVAKDLFDESVILTYGDTYTDLDLLQLVETHDKNNNEATIVVAPIQNPFGLIEYDKKGKVTYFEEKPILNYYIGYAVIKKSALDLIPKKIIDLPDGEGLVTFYKILIAMGKLGVYYHSGLQVTFNTEDELMLAQDKIIKFYTSRENS